jgi:hypothetical protein
VDPRRKAFIQARKKSPVVITINLKPAERTILGLFIQNKYDVKFAPREGMRRISTQFKSYTHGRAYTQDWAAFKDIELV